MSNFISDTKDIDDKINIDLTKVQLDDKPLLATFLPYYIDPKSMKLMVVLKRELLAGAYKRTNRKLGIKCLSTPLPENQDKPLTIEEAFANLNIPATLQDTIPLGSIMTDPKLSSGASEVVLAQIDPIDLIDESRGIVFQQPGEYEVGVVEFDELLGAIQENFIQDVTTRFILGELYIMAIEEANKQNDNEQSMFDTGNNVGAVIGNGSEHGDIDTNTVETDQIPTDILEQNADKHFASIYK